MTKKQKVNRIARALGLAFINKGGELVRSAFHLDPTIISANDLFELLEEKMGPDLHNHVSLADRKYHLASKNTWEWIIDLDLIDQQIYMTDVFDCDEFAFLYASRATSLYHLNTCGVVFGVIYNARTGDRLGRHAFNFIATQEIPDKKVFCYEPMNDGICEVEKGKDIIIKGWKYEPDWYLFW